jgi:CRISPR-associated endonuclease/helicase Cas3
VSSPLSALQKWLLDTAAPWFEVSSCEEKRMLALIKALLIASDVAGSALPRSGKSVQCWVKDALRDTLTSDHLSQLVSKRLGGSPPRAFQTEVHGAGPLAFVRAGCGSGKTAAAYLWASRHAQGRRLFFCYPTTGTATEGFRDYVLESELKDEASLLHGRAAVDLEDILGVEDDDTSSAQRLESLKAWSPLLIICTVDRVLGLMQNNRSGLYAYPALAKGAFVFDEIHLFDDRMFGSLIRFLRDGLPGAPVLLMTASLPASRLAALEEIAAARGATLQVINGPRDLEELPRYCLTAVSPQPDWDRVQATLSHPTRNKVLWVSNTVERAMNFVNEASARDLAPLCYHSRFRYEDRVQRHKTVIDAFKSPAPASVIATQVCEVSLDISADLLISDLAPIPSMIQRLGRLNRRAKPGACDPREAEFLSVDSTLPYDEYSFNIDVSRAWVEELIMDRAVSDRAVSQSDLAAAFKEQKNVFDMRNQRSEWLDGGIHSFPATLRKADTGISVLLPEDAPSCLLPNSKPDRDQIIRKTIPMPMNRAASDWIKWKRIGYIPVAPPGRIKYSKEVGGSWAKS